MEWLTSISSRAVGQHTRWTVHIADDVLSVVDSALHVTSIEVLVREVPSWEEYLASAGVNAWNADREGDNG